MDGMDDHVGNNGSCDCHGHGDDDADESARLDLLQTLPEWLGSPLARWSHRWLSRTNSPCRMADSSMWRLGVVVVVALGSQAWVQKEQVAALDGFGGILHTYFWRYSGSTRLLRQAGMQSLCFHGIYFWSCLAGIFRHFLFLALTLRPAPTLILPLPEVLDPLRMLGR